VTVERNAFGRQLDSFEADLAVPILGDRSVHGVFIRAPVIDHVGLEVDVLAIERDRCTAGVVRGCSFLRASLRSGGREVRKARPALCGGRHGHGPSLPYV